MQMRWSAVLGLLGCVLSAQAAADNVLTNLRTPESAVAGVDGHVYVSEIGEFGQAGDGQISVIDPKGRVRVFADGMDDPKGLAFGGDALYVTDRTRVLKVMPDGQWQVFAPAAAFPRPPQFLNDIEADSQGNLYVSDSGDLQGKGGAIYRISPRGEVALLISGEQDARVLAPNGLLLGGNNTLLQVDFVSGELYQLRLNSGEMRKIAAGFGGGDGLVRGSGGMLYVSDWKHGRVFAVDRQGQVTLVRDGYQAAADIGLSRDGKHLLVPDMKAGELHWLPLP